MKKLALVVSLFVGAITASAQVAPKSVAAYPATAEIERYPIIWTKTPSRAEGLHDMGVLKLHLDTLKVKVVTFNWYRNVARFALDTLPVGTVVYADSANIPRYKADCFNRLVLQEACPNCVSLLAQSGDSLKSDNALIADSTAKKSGLARLYDGAKSFAKNFFAGLYNLLGSLFWLLLMLLALALLVSVLFFLYRIIRDLIEGRRYRGPLFGHDAGQDGRQVVTPPVVQRTEIPFVQPVSSTGATVGGRTYVRFDHRTEGSPNHTIQYRGMRMLRYEESEGGEHTITFRPL